MRVGSQDHRKSFLIVHGWRNQRPAGHWQRWLADQLVSRGHQVEYPQLPEPDFPNADDWTSAVRGCAARLIEPDKVVVCHSLGCLAWLAAVSSSPLGIIGQWPAGSDRVEFRTVLVAPPSRGFLKRTEQLAQFAAAMRWDGEFGERVAGFPTWPAGRHLMRLVRSDNDSYCPLPQDSALPPIAGLAEDVLPGQGHFDMEAGYGSWPEMLAWCEGRRDRIASRLSAHPEPGVPTPSSRPGSAMTTM